MLQPTKRIIIVFANYKYRSILRNWLVRLPDELLQYVRIYTYGRFFTRLLKVRGLDAQMIRPRFESRNQLWRDRLETVLSLVSAGFEVTLADVDAIANEDFYRYTDPLVADIVSSQGTVFPPHAHAEWGFVLCCGFMQFRATDVSCKFLQSALQFEAGDYTDQLAVNSILLASEIEWSLDRERYSVTAMGRTITCYKEEVYGSVKSGEYTGLRVGMLPHSLFRRLPNTFEASDTVVFHPLPGRRGQRHVKSMLKKQSLWGNQ